MSNLLGKFGLEHYDLRTMLWNVGVLMRTLTINIDRDYTTNLSAIWYFITIFSGASYFYVFIFSGMWFVFVRCQETGNFIDAVIIFSVSMCTATCIPKMFYMKCYSKSIISLVETCLQYNETVLKGTRYETNFLGVLKIIKKQGTVAWSVLAFNSIVYVIVPFLRPGRHFAQELLVLYGLEPMYESPNYEIATVAFVASAYFSFAVQGYVTLFIFVIIGFLNAQFLALSKELPNLWADSEKFNNYCKSFGDDVQDDSTRNMFIKKRLRDIVKFHIMNINLKREINDKLRFIFFTDFIFMVFAVVAELLGGLENTGIQMPYTLGMIFLDCYMGQRLIDAGTSFEKAVYNCNWENFNVSNQKTVLIMLQCSGREIKLSPGGMMVLDYPFLMAFLKFTYSAFTTMKSSE